ncbi:MULTISPECIES: autotransporter assembly complex protein TamB [unclassified Pseudoalteromonas]|uniref:autotransporter assembly complex protein TamB n=1 Tax=unclassified Pseudoalteromonas TaxID=194690 RepID=UPI003014C503
MSLRSLSIKLASVLAGLFLLLVCLFFTLPGQQALVWLANQTVSGLQVEQIEQRILSGGSVNLRFENANTRLRVDDTEIRLSLFSCATVCLDIRAENIAVKQKSTTESESQHTENKTIRLPVSVAIERFAVAKLRFENPAMTMTVSDVAGQGQMVADKLSLPWLSIAKFELLTHQQDAPPSRSSATPVQSLPPLQLPQVTLPIEANIGKFTLAELYINKQRFNHLQLQQVEAGQSLRIEEARVNYLQWYVSASLAVELQSWAVRSRTLVSHPQGLASVELQGHLGQQLQLTLNTQGAARAHLQGSVNTAQENWPFSLTAEVDNLVTSSTEYGQLSQAELTLSGNADDYQITADLNASAKGLGEFNANLQGRGNLHQFELTELQLLAGQSQLSANGQLKWLNGIAAELNASASSLPIDNLLGLVQYQMAMAPDDVLNGQLNVAFETAEDNWALDVKQLNLNGKVAGEPLQVEADLNLDKHLQGDLQRGVIQYGNSKITLSGELGRQLDLALMVELDHSANSLLPVAIKGQGEVYIDGQSSLPTLSGSVDLARLSYQDISLTDTRLRGQWNREQAAEGQLQLAVAQLSAAGYEIENLGIQVKGGQQQHQATITVRDPNAVATIKAQGSASPQGWQGQLASAEMTAKGQTIALQAPSKISYLSGQLALEKQCWQLADANLCYSAQQQGESGQAQLALTALELTQIQPWLATNMQLQGLAQARAELQWQGGQLQAVDGKVTVNEASLTSQGQRFAISQFNADVQTNKQQLNTTWQMDSNTLGQFNGTMTMPLAQSDPALAGKITIAAIKLPRLSGLISRVSGQDINLEGEITGAVELAGRLSAPQMSGQVELQQLAMRSNSLPVEIDSGAMQMSFNTTTAQLQGQLATTGGGGIQLDGQFDWSRALAATLKVDGDNIYIQQDSRIEMMVSPKLSLSYRDNIARMTGSVDVPFGRVNIESLPAGVTTKTSDEIIIDSKAKAPMSVPVQHAIDLQVSVADDFRVKALGLDSFVTGSIELQKQLTSPLLATGELQLREGKYRAFGQDLQIKTGQIGFNGALDKPYLNIRAIRNPATTANDVIAGVDLTGSAAKPRLTVFSEPAMDQAKALSYLLNGEPLGESETSNNALLTQFLLSQGIDRSEGFLTQAGESLGLRDVNLSAKGSGDDTQVEVSGYITPNVQVSYRVGVFDSMNEIALRYRVFSKFYIEATSGLYDSIDLLYKFDWDDE